MTWEGEALGEFMPKGTLDFLLRSTSSLVRLRLACEEMRFELLWKGFIQTSYSAGLPPAIPTEIEKFYLSTRLLFSSWSFVL